MFLVHPPFNDQFVKLSITNLRLGVYTTVDVDTTLEGVNAVILKGLLGQKMQEFKTHKRFLEV